MTRSGCAFELPTLARRTAANGSSSSPTRAWPTPAASNPNDGERLENWQARREREKAKGRNGNGMGTPLSIAVRLWRTPQAGEGNGGGQSAKLREAARHSVYLRDQMVDEEGSGQLNPSWVESLMGYPQGWTDIGGLPGPESRSTRGSRRE